MTDNNGRLMSQRRYQPNDVVHHFNLVISRDLMGFVTTTITAHIGRHHVITGGSKGSHLMAP
jgi:hypothetical protein